MEVIGGRERDCRQKYVGMLSAEERGELVSLFRPGKRSAQVLTNTRIALKADVSVAGEGWRGGRIAEALDTGIANIDRTRRQLVEEGFEAALRRKYNPNSARPRIFDGAAEAKLIALACRPAPAGYGKWTLSLLEEKVVDRLWRSPNSVSSHPNAATATLPTSTSLSGKPHHGRTTATNITQKPIGNSQQRTLALS